MSSITFRENGRAYLWEGGSGAIFISWERGVKQGDVRIIKNELFYAYYVEPVWFKKPEIWWTKPGRFTSSEEIKAIRQLMLGGC